jgi:hypothetical protein
MAWTKARLAHSQDDGNRCTQRNDREADEAMKKQCRRKIYKLINPLAFVIEGIKPPQGDKLDKLRTLELSAIESFRTGTATLDDWSHIVGMMNLAENMGHNGIGGEVLPYCEEAHQHLTEAARRYKKTGRMGLTGPALQCLREIYAFHDLQRTSISLGEYERHILDTSNRIRSKAPEVTGVLEAA